MEKAVRSGRKILCLSWRDIGHPKAGGAEVYTHEVLKRLVSDYGYTVDHLGPVFDGGDAEEVRDGVRYLRRGNALTVLWHAYRWVKDHPGEYDVVIDQANTHHFVSPLWLPKGQKSALFIHQLTREIWWYNTKFPLNVCGWLGEKWLMRRHRKKPVLTVSESTKEDLVAWGFAQENIRVMPEGIDFAAWDEAQFFPKEKEMTLLYIGRFARYKGIEDVIRACGYLQQKNIRVKLWLVGKAPAKYKRTLERLIRAAGIEADVVWHGFVSAEMKLELMSRAHMVVVPSHREGWGLVVTEANAVGTIAVAYPSPGLKDSVRDGDTGVLTKYRTPENLAYTLEAVIESPVWRQEMEKRAHAWAKTFNWDKPAAAFYAGVEALIESGGRSSL